MEQRRFSGNSHWYHETQSTLTSQAAPLVPEAADIEDRFLLGLASACTGELQETLFLAQPALLASREMYDVLLPRQVTTSLTHTLTLYDRLSTALTVAQVTGIQRLCNHYAARLNPLPGPDSSRESNHRLTQITEYARQLASQPTLITPAALMRLDEVGLTAPDIITFSQIIGFVGYQARVVAGIHALLALPVCWIPGVTIPADADPFLPGEHWQPQLPPVELRYASARQLEALTFCQPQAVLKESAWLLAHDASALYGWGRLFGTLEASLDTPEGALAAAVAARINGSAACFYRYPAGALRDALQQGTDRAMAAANDKERAVIQAAAQLTRSPERVNTAQIQPLKTQAFTPGQMLNIFQSTALASWNNRLMQSLGTTA
ncbi:CMD domain-containing protein [Erwinia tasmaniensis]|uniref:CMD domain-containing protein n=1 Tax=Erwinia tasmaniensis TaxID=338565 RepID=UPI003A4D40F1